MYILVCNLIPQVKIGSIVKSSSYKIRDGSLVYVCADTEGRPYEVKGDDSILITDQTSLTLELGTALRSLLAVSLWKGSNDIDLLKVNRKEADWTDLFWNLLPPQGRNLPMSWVMAYWLNIGAGTDLIFSLYDSKSKELLARRSKIFESSHYTEELVSFLFVPKPKIRVSLGIKSVVRMGNDYDFMIMNEGRSAIITNHSNLDLVGSTGTVRWTSKGLSLVSSGEVIGIESNQVVILEDSGEIYTETSILVKLRLAVQSCGLNMRNDFPSMLLGGKEHERLLSLFLQLLSPFEVKSSLARLLYGSLLRGSLRVPSNSLWLSGAVLSGISNASVFTDLNINESLVEAKRRSLLSKRVLTRPEVIK